MTLIELEEVLRSTGLPVAYRAWPTDMAPPLPYICYLVAFSNNFAADGVVYMRTDRVQVELYTRSKEPDEEDKVERALSSFYWEKEENYIDTEQVYQILYEIEV